MESGPQGLDDGEYVFGARLEDLDLHGQIPVTVGGVAVLICRSDGEIFAVTNRCTHEYEALWGGTVRKCSIVCPHHGARYSLRDGAVMGGPAMAPLRTFPVRLRDGAVEIRVD